jgi:hypothetical protein
MTIDEKASGDAGSPSKSPLGSVELVSNSECRSVSPARLGRSGVEEWEVEKAQTQGAEAVTFPDGGLRVSIPLLHTRQFDS